MNHKYNDVALLLQGPIDKEKLAFSEYMPYYRILFSEIVLSTYTEYVNDELIKYCSDFGITLVHQPIDIGTLEKRYNIGYQTMTVLAGLQQVTKKYTLKHRTDERYFSLDKVVDKFLEDDRKWVSGSTVFGAKSYYPFHAADHLFIAPTDKLRETFMRTKIGLEKDEMVRNVEGEPAPEITFTMNYIRSWGEEPDIEKHDEQMLKYFNFVNDKHLYPFLIRFNTVNQVYTEIDQLRFNEFNDMNDILTRSGMSV